MKTWWRDKPLNETEQYLLDALFHAHHESSFRGNVSTINVINTAAGSNDVAKAIASGILTVGGRHAPIEQTYEFLNLDRPAESVEHMIAAKKKIPGWGNSFTKESDPIWSMVDSALHEYYDRLWRDIRAVTERLAALKRPIYPNPSCYTAATAIALGVPRKAAVCLFISARLDAWSSIAFNQLEH